MATSKDISQSRLKSFLVFLPIFKWISIYEKAWLRPDLMAGLAVWAMTVPQALAYAGIAGVPPVYGLYAIPFAMIAYAIFGTSRTLCVGPESAIAIISAVTIGSLAGGDPAEFLVLTALLTLIVGVMFLLFGVLRLGWAANFLSQPVLQGFTQGIALTVIVGQIPTILGMETAYSETLNGLSEQLHVGFFVKTWALFATLGDTAMVTTMVGLGSLVLLFALKKFVPGSPSALIAVIIGVGAVVLLGLTEQGVRVVGEVESGMVSLHFPTVSFDNVVALLPGAFAITLLGYSISLSVATVGAETTGEKIEPNQELIALGVANLGSALSSGFVVCGSLSRGVVIRRAGGRTQIITLINAGLVILTLVVLLPFFFKLPFATLSAIVVQAMLGLISVDYFKRLYKIDRAEFLYGLAAMFGVLIFGLLEGVAIGVILSLVVLIRNVTRPVTAVLGEIEEKGAYRDTVYFPEAKTIPGLLIFRFDAPIIFPNAAYFVSELHSCIESSETPVRKILVAAQQINQIDSTGSDHLARLLAELNGLDIELSFAEAKKGLRMMMVRTGLEEKVGTNNFYNSLSEGVEAFTNNPV